MQRTDKEILNGHFSRREMPKEVYEIFKELSDMDIKDYTSYDRAFACCVTKLNQRMLEESNTKISWNRSLDRWLGVEYDESLWNRKNDFLDHIHFRTHKGNVTLVSEPYSIDLNTLKDIIDFCDKFNLHFYQSWIDPPIWFPNHTIALCFNRRPKEKKGRD